MSVFWSQPTTVGSIGFFGDRLSITALADGGYVISHTSMIEGDNDIVFRIYNADGSVRSDSVIVNPADSFFQSGPMVFPLLDGNFAVLWSVPGASIQRFSPSGQPIGDIVDVGYNGYAIETANGGVAIAHSLPINSFENDVALTILAPNGQVSSPLLISDAPGNQYSVVITATHDGYLIFWGDNNGTAGDIMMRHLSADFTNMGAVQVANTKTDLAQSLQSVITLQDGRVLAIWNDFTGTGSQMVVKGRIFNPNGTAAGAEFQLTTAATQAVQPNVVALTDGGFALSYGVSSSQQLRLAQFNSSGLQVGNDIVLGSGRNDVWGIVYGFVGLTQLEDGRIAATWTGQSEYLTRIIDFRNGQVVGDSNDNILLGNSAYNDVIYANGGNDFIDGLAGADQLYGGSGDDHYVADRQDDLLFETAGEGTDTVESSSSYYLYANVENLTLTGSAGNFGVGNELANVLIGNAGENLLIAGAGNDTVNGGGSRDAIFGEDGADVLNGDAGIDYIVAGIGNDIVDGGADADEIYGQDGDDILRAGASFDTDIMVGGAGSDTLYGNSGLGDYDLLYGNEGNDIFYVDTPSDLVFEQAGEGSDTVYADISGAGYYLYANIENLVLLDDTPFGVGNALDNQLTGSATGNYLLGGAGNDIINGMGGNDVLFGEGGNDVFIFDPGTGGDVIGDFTRGQDRIDISGYGLSFAQLQANFVQNGNVGAIQFANGDLIVLHNVTMSQLTAADFILAPVAESAPKIDGDIMDVASAFSEQPGMSMFHIETNFTDNRLQSWAALQNGVIV